MNRGGSKPKFLYSPLSPVLFPRGPALLAIALMALSPLIMAHTSLTTMDMGFATMGLLAVMSLGEVLRKPTRPSSALSRGL